MEQEADQAAVNTQHSIDPGSVTSQLQTPESVSRATGGKQDAQIVLLREALCSGGAAHSRSSGVALEAHGSVMLAHLPLLLSDLCSGGSCS